MKLTSQTILDDLKIKLEALAKRNVLYGDFVHLKSLVGDSVSDAYDIGIYDGQIQLAQELLNFLEDKAKDTRESK